MCIIEICIVYCIRIQAENVYLRLDFTCCGKFFIECSLFRLQNIAQKHVVGSCLGKKKIDKKMA